jgi:hypothetical protein
MSERAVFVSSQFAFGIELRTALSRERNAKMHSRTVVLDRSSALDRPSIDHTTAAASTRGLSERSNSLGTAAAVEDDS